jgi:hypothetical protein
VLAAGAHACATVIKWRCAGTLAGAASQHHQAAPALRHLCARAVQQALKVQLLRPSDLTKLHGAWLLGVLLG